VPRFTKGGRTNLIWVELTANNPQAAPSIATETPFSSIGKGGVRFDSDALALLTVALPGARLTLDSMMATSPAANPIGTVTGLTDGLGDGLGLGLGLGVAVGLATGTLSKLAPVSRDIVPGDSVVMLGSN
jgi:hypothetical protein